MKWTAKARHGQPCYLSLPTISEPAEFGHTVLVWWCDIQPVFCKGDGVLPNETYNDGGGSGDVWAPLRKGGPNGFLSMLTLLAWWGQCCAAQSRWEESTESLWNATVLDVSKTLEMIASKADQKRGRDHDGGPTSTKQYVIFQCFYTNK
jgi:hypothetical protein